MHEHTYFYCSTDATETGFIGFSKTALPEAKVGYVYILRCNNGAKYLWHSGAGGGKQPSAIFSLNCIHEAGRHSMLLLFLICAFIKISVFCGQFMGKKYAYDEHIWASIWVSWEKELVLSVP